MNKKEFKVGDKVKILLDPLSHGGDMSSLLLEVEVLDREESIQCDDDGGVEVMLDVAIYRVLSEKEVEWGGGEEVSYGNWAHSPMVGRFESIVSLNGGRWHYTVWPTEVDFVEEVVSE